jgi:hypothetical protein
MRTANRSPHGANSAVLRRFAGRGQQRGAKPKDVYYEKRRKIGKNLRQNLVLKKMPYRTIQASFGKTKIDVSPVRYDS